ncbi:MAG: MotA/TolQ/ExbB proton channel family protein [Pirellulaceae bacterium]|nr:MotA/TolQ/ExbB proton channel family protein [Pirellulaceae bacterium]
MDGTKQGGTLSLPKLFRYFSLTFVVLVIVGSFANTVSQAQEVSPSTKPSEALDSEAEIPMKNLLQVIQEGGPLMIPIGICSLILCAFSLERTVALRRKRVLPAPFIKRFISQAVAGELTQQEALKRCQESQSAVALVFASAVRKWGRTTVEIEQAIIDEGERVTNKLRRYLRLFNVISTVCPLLGLLGTVLGMINAFNNIASADAMGQPELLATGISQALLTTAAGLSVAIPAYLIYMFFASRVDQMVMEIDSQGQKLVNAIALDGWNPNEVATTTKATKKKVA